MSKKDNDKRMSLEEYQKKYSKPYNEKAAKSFLFIFGAAIGIIIIFCLFSIVMKVFEINKIAGYVSIGLAVIIYLFVYVIPLIKLNQSSYQQCPHVFFCYIF